MKAPGPNQPVCVYCGAQEGLTFDHVPPKLLLSKPYPKNLITVPACGNCNRSFQSDDEYTRFVAANDFRAADNCDLKLKLDAIRRSLERPNARQFAGYLTAQFRPTRILSSAGSPMGREFEIDRKRVNATGSRIVRALFFVETGDMIPPSTNIRIAANVGIDHTDPGVLQFARVYKLCKDHRARAIGSAFSYVAAFGPDFSIWLMMLYDCLVWMSTVPATQGKGISSVAP